MNDATPTPEAPAPNRARPMAGRQLALLLVVVILALVLRLQGLDWDGGNFYHPDERSIYLRAECMHLVLTEGDGWRNCQNHDFPLDEPGFPSLTTLLDKDASPLNPHWFPLGSIIIYLLVGIRFLLEPFMDQVRLQDFAAAGRALAAFADAASVALLFFLGRRLYGQGAGLLAAALFALTVAAIQTTHFYRPESFVILLALAAFWQMLNAHERRRWRDHLLLGLVIGVTFAFRGSSLPILAPVALVYLAFVWRQWEQTPSPVGVARAVAPRAALALLTAAIAFIVLQPYALLDYQKYVADLGWEVGVARMAGSVQYTVQYIGTPLTGAYELRQTVVWALGLPLGVLAWGGLAATVVAAFRRPRMGDWLLLSWVVVLLAGVVPLFEVKFLRYVIPVLPVMTLLGSRWAVAAVERAADRRVLRRVAQTIIALALAATAFYALAFVSTYWRDHPGVQASEWVQANVPQGAAILTDNHWDEGFAGLGRYSVAQMPMYEGDTTEKVNRVAEMLAGADYIMAYSNRPWGSIARLPERYPYSSAYYHALFDGSLGYELAQGFARYPTLFGVSFVHDPFTRAGVQPPPDIPGVEPSLIALDLGYADENVVNYDHPLVLVWRNTGRLAAGDIRAIMLSGDGSPVERAMLTEEEFVRQTEGGTWTDIFDEGGLNAWAPWLVWLIVVEAIFLAALPLSARLLRWLPDRGIVLARPLGLLLVAWIVWLGASVGVWTFSRWSAAAAVGLVAAASAVALVRNPRLLGAARRNWKALASMEALFVAAYLAFVLVRAANPDLWHAWRGGEKPMDLAYLTAVVKSSTFPPFDPWFAGGYINYYYFGFVIVGALMRLTGIVPEVAYNLAVPLLFALTLTGAYSVGYNLAEALRQRSRLPRGGWLTRPRGAVAAGAAAALLVAVLANVDGAVQLLQGAARTLGDGDFGRFDYWRSSRLMPGQISITEFPFWTFLFADLHAHLIALPFQIVAVGLAANLVLGARAPGSLRRLFPAVVALAFVVGSLAAINTWDVPAYGLLGLAAIVIAMLTRRAAPLDVSAVAKTLLLIVVFGVVLYGAWLPFHEHYEAPNTGLRRSEWQTVLWHYLGIHALLIFIAASWLIVEAKRHLFTRSAPPAEPLTAQDAAPAPQRTFRWIDAILAVQAAAVVIGVVAVVEALRPWTTLVVLLVFAAIAVAIAIAWLTRRSEPQAPVQLLLLAALLLALGIGMGVDVVGARVDIDRMNTVFKLYLNAWVLFGIVGGVGLWSLLAAHGRGVRALWAYAPWLAVLAALVLASAVFPVLGTRARLADRFEMSGAVTLDGRAYQNSAIYGDPGPTGAESDDVRYALAADAAAIDYLRANVQGSPVVLEGVTEHTYRWYPRVARDAGLPVVVGWLWHQSQQRGDGGADPTAISARLWDVDRMYNTTSEAEFLELARKRRVEFVYVGPVEQTYFRASGLAKFERMAGSSLETFYRSDEVAVYRVKQSETDLAEGESGLNTPAAGDSLPDASQQAGGASMQETAQFVRDILLSVYLVAGVVLTLALVVIVCLLYRAVRKLLRALTQSAENVSKLTEAVVDNVVTPLSEGITFTSAAGNALGFATGLIGGVRGRNKKPDDKDRDKDDKRRGRRRR